MADEAEDTGADAPKKKKKREKAKRADYVRLMLDMSKGEVRRDLLDDLLYIKSPAGTWQGLHERLPIIRSEARERNGFFDPLSAFEDHGAWYREQLKPGLLIDIPKWDGEDRIEEICEHLEFEGIETGAFYECICEWGATMFRRLEDPSIQPVTPIIHGPQGVGKDTLIAALTGGWGPYSRKLQIRHKDSTETERMLSRGICFNIPEFDRTSKTDHNTIKHLLSTDTVDVRDPYERAAKQKFVRCSFISSVNIRDVFVDETGARRFWFFTMKNGGFKMRTATNGRIVGAKPVQLNEFSEKRGAYPGHYWRAKTIGKAGVHAERLQILAQFRYYAEKGYFASLEAVSSVESIMDTLIPDAKEDMIVEEFFAAQERHLEKIGLSAKLDLPRTAKGELVIPNFDMTPVIDSLARSYNTSGQTIRRMLKGQNLQVIVKQGAKSARGWRVPTGSTDGAPLQPHEEPSASLLEMPEF